MRDLGCCRCHLSFDGLLLDARLVGRTVGIGFTQKLKRKANEEEILRRKKQLRSCSQCLKEQIEAGKSRIRGRWSGFIFILRLGYKVKDVAKCLGRDAATVRFLVSRFAVHMNENETLRKQAVRLAADCRE